MHIVIIGGSGFIGTALAKLLTDDGCIVTVLTRSRAVPPCHAGAVRYISWDGHNSAALTPILEATDAVVNLAGENIAAQRWTPARLDEILFSRTRVGEAVRSACMTLHTGGRRKPYVLVQASAIGFYGCWEDMEQAPSCDERSASGSGELAAVARHWEECTAGMAVMGIRRCVMRFAPVLGRGGGMLARMLPLFRLGLGGIPGSGRQPVSWVHIQDVTAAIRSVLWNNSCAGVYNVVSPETVSMQCFAAALGKAVHRSVKFHIPALILRAAVGDMADELLLAGQVAVPRRLLHSGFQFAYPQLSAALAEVTGAAGKGADKGGNR